MRPVCVVVLLALLPACSGQEPSAPVAPAETPAELIERLHASFEELAARPEHAADQVTLQHLLVAVSGGGASGANRSQGEAEELAAQLFARARAGEDFDLLVKNHTNEVHPGIYTLSASLNEPPRVHLRSTLVPGLGDVAWRLRVGELGVTQYDGGVPDRAPRSPLGYHIVLRLE